MRHFRWAATRWSSLALLPRPSQIFDWKKSLTRKEYLTSAALQVGDDTSVKARVGFKEKSGTEISWVVSQKLRPDFTVMVTSAIRAQQLTDMNAHRCVVFIYIVDWHSYVFHCAAEVTRRVRQGGGGGGGGGWSVVRGWQRVEDMSDWRRPAFGIRTTCRRR